jgi:hypothetical protein
MLLIAVTVLPVTGIKNVDKLTREIRDINGAESTINIQDINGVPQPIASSEQDSNQGDLGDRGGDVLVAGGTVNQVNSSIASDSSGDLYIAVERPPGVYMYKSTDDGLSWGYWAGFSATGMANPSVAIGKGFNQDKLLLACSWNGAYILVYRFNLSNPSDWDLPFQHYNGMGVANPKIVTDYTEYATWYAYLVYNEGTLTKQDAWELSFARSSNYGDNWAAPIMLYLYEEWPFYDGRSAHPDIDYGSDNLFVAFDDYDFNDNERDVYTMNSSDFGVTWNSPVKVADDDARDEYDPSVAVVKWLSKYTTTILISYTRMYSVSDNDIFYAYSQDGGATWIKNGILEYSGANDLFSDVETSYGEGLIHAVYLDDSNIYYKNTAYGTPTLWTSRMIITDVNAAALYSPSIAVNPTQAVNEEAAITWTDFRNVGDANDIYFDSLINTPPNTPAAPTGPTTRLIGQSGKYFTTTTDPDFDQVQYRFDWDASGTHQYSAWTSLVNSGQTVNKTHSWSSPGTYVVKTQARDEHGAASTWSNGLAVTVGINHAPNKPKKPTGPTTRLIGQAGTYWANGTDPDGDKIQYRFDWNASGSHSYSGWTSLVNSGTKLSKNHTWTVAGTYVVKVQSKDEHGVTSTWSNGLNVTVANHAPNKPKKPTGPTTRLIGQQGTYWANGTDPDGDKIQYRFDWDAAGSHAYSGWTSLVNSGTKLSKTHSWAVPGTYVVKVQSRDEHGATSVWSTGLTVIVSA